MPGHSPIRRQRAGQCFATLFNSPGDARLGQSRLLLPMLSEPRPALPGSMLGGAGDQATVENLIKGDHGTFSMRRHT